MYCGAPTKRRLKGEHILQLALRGAKTLNDPDVCRRAVCPECNNGFLSQIDKELCSRSYLSIVASQKIDAHLWQSWDIDHASGNLLVEARPSWAPDGSLTATICYPQIAFERDGRLQVRSDSEEFLRFGQEDFPKVLFKAIRRSFDRYRMGEKGFLHFERIQSGMIYDGCRLPPRIFANCSIYEIARKINEQSFILRFVSEEDKRFALNSLSKLDDGRQVKSWCHTPGSHTPSICCSFNAGDTLRALMKIGLNLIGAYCPNTPVDRESFAADVRVIRGDDPITQWMLLRNGFVLAKDVEPFSGAVNEHSFRMVHVDQVWHVYLSFFGGSIGAYVQLHGPNHENWSCANIVAPMKSKQWTISTSRIIPFMRPHVQWKNSEKVTPTVKMQKSDSILHAEVVRKKK
jgi:hypothetical protein